MQELSFQVKHVLAEAEGPLNTLAHTVSAPLCLCQLPGLDCRLLGQFFSSSQDNPAIAQLQDWYTPITCHVKMQSSRLGGQCLVVLSCLQPLQKLMCPCKPMFVLMHAGTSMAASVCR